MKHISSISLLLAFFWLTNSGHYSMLIMGLGALSVALVVWLIIRMDVIDHESQPLHIIGHRLLGYYIWLSGKIIQSNIDVAKCVWLGNTSISPGVRWIPLTQSTDMGKVIYANSVTLTPGTVAMDLTDDQVYVHALTTSGLDEVTAGEMDRRVTELER